MSLREAVLATVRELEGAYAIAVISSDEPGRVVGARRGAPLLVGVGIGENFLGSDAQALIQVTNKMHLSRRGRRRRDHPRQRAGVRSRRQRRSSAPMHESELSADAVERGEYRHYMQKEIFEQPRAVADTLEARIGPHGVLPNIFGVDGDALLAEHARPAHHRLRHQLPRRPGRQVLDRGVRAPAGERRGGQRIPLPRSGGADRARCSSPSRSPAKRPTRWPPLRESRRRGYLGTLAICNVPEVVAGARVRSQADDPRRPGDRRGLDQGVHHPAGRRSPC